MDVALGREPADLVIRNGSVLNVHTEELLDGVIGIKGSRIAYVGPENESLIGESTRIIDADGQTIIPGLIDGHTHLLYRYSIEEFLRYAIPDGTTSIITETTELGSVVGLDGMIAAIEAFSDQPIKIFCTAAPLCGPAPFTEEIAPSLDQMRALLARNEVVGIGEIYWANLLRYDQRLLELIVSSRRYGKAIEGHAAGAKGAKLLAYACAGVSSCHEPITAEEALERLRLGFHVMIREGEVRRDLEAISAIWQKPVSLRRLILVTDSVGPSRLIEQGYIGHVVRKAIALGLEPIKAIQMCTLNVAEHFRLDSDIGSIAPGRCADLLLIPDLRTIKPSLVISNGKAIAREGKLLVEPRRPNYPQALYRTVRMKKPFSAEDFVISLKGASSASCKARAIELVTRLVTREAEVDVPVREGVLRPDPNEDLLTVAAIDRVKETGQVFCGFLKGFGPRSGACATTMCWDSQCMVVVGADPSDMASAANRLVEIQGGAVVVSGGKRLAEFQAPIGGILSQAPITQIASELEAIDSALSRLGARFEQPLLTLDVLTTAAIPHFRITERGYVRLKDGKLVDLFVEQ